MEKYIWQITPEIKKLLIQLESLRLLFDTIPIDQLSEVNIRRHSLLKSAVYSARIEGFPDTEQFPKKESQNLLSAYNFVHSNSSPKKISLSFIYKLHKTVLKGLSSEGGSFRKDTWAIFNQAGIAIYLAPPPHELPELMAEYISFINTLPENPVIKAAIAQFVFEKIHPFPDGNGRVGRLISSLIINKSDYNFRSLAPIEDFINTHREDYYYNLEPTNICTGFIEFFLKSLIEQAKKHLPVLSSTAQKNLPEDSLMPRRRELLDTIRDHPNCSIDFLYRRFLKINRKTIAYDLSRLQKKGFVKKIGTTRGALYISVYT